MTIVKSSEGMDVDRSAGVLEVAGRQKHLSGHWLAAELHWLLHVAVLTSTAVLTHTNGDWAGSNAGERGAAQLAMNHIAPPLPCLGSKYNSSKKTCI